jgi:hypothetical protein
MLLLSSILLYIHPTSTTLFPILSKQSVLVLSFEYLTDSSIAWSHLTSNFFWKVQLLVHPNHSSNCLFKKKKKKKETSSVPKARREWVSIHTRSHHTVSSTMGEDTCTTNPRWRVDSIERGGGRELGRRGVDEEGRMTREPPQEPLQKLVGFCSFWC